MKPTIALFIYDPKCSVQSGNGIIRALQSYYNFKIFGKNELEKVFFDDVDMIAVPGGLLAAGFKKQKLRAHSDMMWNTACNEWALTFGNQWDIQCEAKGKNLASEQVYNQRLAQA